MPLCSFPKTKAILTSFLCSVVVGNGILEKGIEEARSADQIEYPKVKIKFS